MQLSNVQEEISAPRKLYMGIENFQATAVNPTLAELNKMGIPATIEPEYVTKVQRNFGGGEEEYDAVNIRIYLTNNDTTNPIKTQVNYQVIRHNHISSTNKLKVLNKYGTSTWLEQEHIDAGTLPANMQWFVNEDIKVCLRGEDTLVSFLRAYRNLPNIKITSDKATAAKGVIILTDADWDKMFKGDFNDIRDAIIGVGDKGKVGYLLGIKHLEDKDVQSLYKASPLKRFVKKVGGNEYLTKDVNNSQEAGAYSDVTFDVTNFKLREYDPSMDKVSPEDIKVHAYSEDDDLPF